MRIKTHFYLIISILLTSCAGIIPKVSEIELESSHEKKPAWYDKIIEEEDNFVFATGNSQPRPTVADAKNDALADAVDEVVKYSKVTVESFSRSIEVSSTQQSKEYYRSDFNTQRRIRANAFIRWATPMEWYIRKMARMRGNRKISEYYLASVHLRVPQKEIERIQKEKNIKLSLDIGIYFENEQGKLKYITEGAVLHSGNAYTLYIRPTDECYLYIYQVDDLGRSYRLFPNEEYNTGANPVRAGEDYWIPNTEQYFVLDEIIGKERLYLFASSERIVELEGSSELEQADFDRVLKTMGVAGLKEKLSTYQVKPPKKKVHVAEIKRKLQAEGAFVYETWFWHR